MGKAWSAQGSTAAKQQDALEIKKPHASNTRDRQSEITFIAMGISGGDVTILVAWLD
jgi:hypothetical protein